LTNYKLVAAEEVRADDKSVDRMLSYFERKTQGARLARRSDVNPSELKDFLPEICFFSLVYDEEGAVSDAIVRLEGTSATSFYGEFTDQSVRNHPSPEVSERILTAARKTVENRCPFFSEAASLSEGKDNLMAKALYVPMAEDGIHIDRLFIYIRLFQQIGL